MFTQQFDSFVCAGDYITCELDGFEFKASLVGDMTTKPTDFDCYEKETIQNWYDDKWQFYGLVISAEYNGVLICEHLESLWGIEGNFPSGNSHFLELANDLLPEALKQAQKELEILRGKLL